MYINTDYTHTHTHKWSPSRGPYLGGSLPSVLYSVLLLPSPWDRLSAAAAAAAGVSVSGCSPSLALLSGALGGGPSRCCSLRGVR